MLLNTWNDYDRITQESDDAAAQRAYAAFVKSQNSIRHADAIALGVAPPPKNNININKINSENHSPNTANEDDMQQTLLLVRQRLRAARLEEEHLDARQSLDRTTSYGKNVVMAIELEQTKSNTSAAKASIMSLAEQIRNNHTPIPVTEALGLASAFPKRSQMTTRQLRDELVHRDVHREQNLAVSGESSYGRRRQRTTIESFGGMGLGEMLKTGARPSLQQNLNLIVESSEMSEMSEIRPRRRPRANIQIDFGGPLGDILQERRDVPVYSHDSRDEKYTQHSRHIHSGQQQSNPAARHATEWAGSGSLDDVLSSSALNHERNQIIAAAATATATATAANNPPRRRTALQEAMLSASSFGGSLEEVMPPVPRARQQQTNISSSRSNNNRSNNNRSRHRSSSSSRRNAHRSTVNADNVVSVTNDDALLREFMVLGSMSSTSHNHSNDFMNENEMTYERLLALDEGIETNRRVTVAQRSEQTTPEALFKSLQVTSYRSKKTKKECGDDTEEDDCAICLETFKHRQSGKSWPCGHFFHAKCTKELLKFDTRCPLCRYDLVTKSHG